MGHRGHKEIKTSVKPKATYRSPTTDHRSPITPHPSSLYHFFVITGILLLTWASFYTSLLNDFTNWDDETYLIDNEYIKHLSWDRVKYFITHFYYGNYHPITMITYLLEHHFYKLDPSPFHRHNLIMHLVNTAVVYFLIYKLSGRKDITLIVTLLFGVHPMRTESVAWVSERKDVLFCFFYLLSLIFYTDYVRKTKGKSRNYLLVILFFILSLLSKPAAVPLPLTLLTFDYLLKRKMKWNILIEKIPHFLLALVFGIVAVIAQQSSDAIAKFETFTLFQRLMFASFGFDSYIAMLFVPVNQSCFHPYPFLIDGKRLPYIYYISPFIAIALAIVVIWLWWKVRKREMLQIEGNSKPVTDYLRTLVFGFSFYLFNVMLTLQWVSVGNAVMAERYTYIPYIGWFYMIAQGFALLYQYKGNFFITMRTVIIVLFICIIAGCSYATYERCKAWKDAEVLWTDFIGKYPYYHDGYYTRAGYRARLKQYDKAMEDYTMCIKLKPDLAKSYAYRGNIYGLHGKPELALDDYNKAIGIDSTYFDAYVNRAITFSMLKQYDNAFSDYDKALSIEPGNVNMLVNRSYAYIETKQYDKAVSDCNKILSINPNHEQANLYMGICNFNTGKIEESIGDFAKCLEANPSNQSAHLNLSLCYKSKKEYALALEYAMKSVSLGNKVEESYINELKKLSQ